MATRSLLVKWVVIFVVLFLVGCPAAYEVKIKNDAVDKIQILSGYSDLVLSEIAPGEIAVSAYNFDCIRVRSSEVIREFKPVSPPNKFVKNGVFSSSFSAVFTSDRKFYIYYYDQGVKEGFYLDEGC